MTDVVALGALGDADCLVHVLGFVDMPGYVALAATNKTFCAFLVRDDVLRAVWGPRVCAAGRFDDRFSPHQCTPDRLDPQVFYAVPRAWRAAAWLVDSCHWVKMFLVHLHALNTTPTADNAAINGHLDAPERYSNLFAARSNKQLDGALDDTPWSALWHNLWLARWRAALKVRASAALFHLASMLDPAIRLVRSQGLTQLSPRLLSMVLAHIGCEFYIAQDHKGQSRLAAPRDNVSLDVILLRCIYRDDSVRNSLCNVISLAFGESSYVPGAVAAIVDRRANIAHLLVRAGNLWNRGPPSGMDEAFSNDAWCDLVAYASLRTRVYHARDTGTKVGDTLLNTIVPRHVRQQAARLWLACHDLGIVLSPKTLEDRRFVKNPPAPQSDLVCRMIAATATEALDMLTEASPAARAIIDANPMLLAPRIESCTKQRHSPYAPVPFTAGMALVARIGLWGLVMLNDMRLAVIALQIAGDVDLQYLSFHVTVLVDILVAWGATEGAGRCRDQDRLASISIARSALLSWASSRGPACMEYLAGMAGSREAFGRILTFDACRDLVFHAVYGHAEAARQIGNDLRETSEYDRRPAWDFAHLSAGILRGVDTTTMRPHAERLTRIAESMQWCIDNGVASDATVARTLADALACVGGIVSLANTFFVSPLA